jgi:hypothetical protein
VVLEGPVDVAGEVVVGTVMVVLEAGAQDVRIITTRARKPMHNDRGLFISSPPQSLERRQVRLKPGMISLSF